jgi:hypothetical protein
VEKELVDSVGFVEAKGIQPISVPSAHSFRLVHESGFWHVHMSFFGGRIGAYMGFPGQNREAWRTADIVMPLKAGEPSVQTSRMIHRLPYKVEIKDFRKIVPSIEAVNVESISVTKEVRLRSPRKSHQPPPPPTH